MGPAEAPTNSSRRPGAPAVSVVSTAVPAAVAAPRLAPRPATPVVRVVAPAVPAAVAPPRLAPRPTTPVVRVVAPEVASTVAPPRAAARPAVPVVAAVAPAVPSSVIPLRFAALSAAPVVTAGAPVVSMPVAPSRPAARPAVPVVAAVAPAVPAAVAAPLLAPRPAAPVIWAVAPVVATTIAPPRPAARPTVPVVAAVAPAVPAAVVAPLLAPRPAALVVGAVAPVVATTIAPPRLAARPAVPVIGAGATDGAVRAPMPAAPVTMATTAAASGGSAPASMATVPATPVMPATAAPATPADRGVAFVHDVSEDPPLGARLSLDEHARSRARSRAARGSQNPALHRLSRYVAAVEGVGRVDDPTVQATAAMVSAASTTEKINPEVRLLVHMSGVDPAGSVALANIYGAGRAVDSDVLRAMSQVHQFIRGRDSLRGITLPIGGEPARLVEDDSIIDGVLPEGMTTKDYLDIMTSAVDADLPPPLSIQRMARRMLRTAAGLSIDMLNSESDSSGSEDWVQLPFTLESADPPPPYQPSEKACSFLKTLMVANHTTALLVRLTLWAAVAHLTGRVHTLPRYVTECTARWWPHKLPAAVVPNDGLPGERWPIGVLVDRRLLSVTARSRAYGATGAKLVTLFGIPANKATCTQDEAVDAMLLLWDKEPSAHAMMRHCRFRAEVVQRGQDNLAQEEAAAAVQRASAALDAAEAVESATVSAAATAVSVPSAASVRAPVSEVPPLEAAITIAPRPAVTASASPAPAAASSGVASAGVLSDLSARAASRAAAADAAAKVPRATCGRSKRAAAPSTVTGSVKRTRRTPTGAGLTAAVQPGAASLPPRR